MYRADNWKKLVRMMFLGLIACLSAVQLAWACTPAATAESSSSAGPSGTIVKITGKGFLGPEASSAPVEIRWNSPTGPVLTATNGPEFSVPVTIPQDATAGLFYLVAIQTNGPVAEGSHATAKAATVFEVVSSQDAVSGGRATANGASAADLWSGFSDQLSGGTAPGEATSPSGAPGTGRGAPAIALIVAGAGLSLMLCWAALARPRRRSSGH